MWKDLFEATNDSAAPFISFCIIVLVWHVVTCYIWSSLLHSQVSKVTPVIIIRGFSVCFWVSSINCQLQCSAGYLLSSHLWDSAVLTFAKDCTFCVHLDGWPWNFVKRNKRAVEYCSHWQVALQLRKCVFLIHFTYSFTTRERFSLVKLVLLSHCSQHLWEGFPCSVMQPVPLQLSGLH